MLVGDANRDAASRERVRSTRARARPKAFCAGFAFDDPGAGEGADVFEGGADTARPARSVLKLVVATVQGRCKSVPPLNVDAIHVAASCR